MRRSSKKDNNHNEVVISLERAGVEWFDTSQFSSFGCDGIAIFKGRTSFVEIKNGGLAKSKQVLTTKEKKVMGRVLGAGGHHVVVNSVLDALRKLVL